jgi:hypothetical protein
MRSLQLQQEGGGCLVAFNGTQESVDNILPAIQRLFKDSASRPLRKPRRPRRVKPIKYIVRFFPPDPEIQHCQKEQQWVTFNAELECINHTPDHEGKFRKVSWWHGNWGSYMIDELRYRQKRSKEKKEFTCGIYDCPCSFMTARFLRLHQRDFDEDVHRQAVDPEAAEAERQLHSIPARRSTQDLADEVRNRQM